MARKRGGLVKAHVETRMPDDIDLSAILDQVEGAEERLATVVAEEARNSTAFTDDTGKLRKSIKVEKNPDGPGYVVSARDPKAHLIEFGHAMVTKDGRTVGHVEAKPFLGPARDKVLPMARQIIEGNG